MKKSVLVPLCLPLLLTGCMYGSYPAGGSSYPSSGNGYPASGNPRDDTYPGTGSSQPTAGNRSADQDITVRGIRLTRDYTILDLTYTNREQPRYDQQGRQMSTYQISFRTTATLVGANGARVFRFIKADGIPEVTAQQPLQRQTFPGDVVNFSVYFERLDKGLENFDLFECNDYDQITCWNIYDLFVRNPADAVVYTPPTPAPAPRPRPTTSQPLPPSQSGGETATPTRSAPTPEVNFLLISGNVTDIKNKRPLSATISYQLSSSKRAVDSVQSFASTGAYRMTLTRGQIYTYVASARGYLAMSGVLDLSKATGKQTISRDIGLTPLAVGDKITLKNIYFELSKSDLLTASFAELDKLVAVMHDTPTMNIRLEGHTDIIGDHAKNLQLSQDRVAACRGYLIQQGIDAARIQATGYGDTRPIVTTGSDETRKVNRRVEFVVLSL